MDLKIGDLVQCRENHYNQGLGLVGKIGMVAELRKKDLRILFDANNQEIWLSKQGVNRIVLPPTDSPTLLDRLSWLIHQVDAGVRAGDHQSRNYQLIWSARALTGEDP